MSTYPNSTEQAVIPVTSLQEFFRDSFETALANNNVSAQKHTEYYVVNLLTLFSRADAFNDSTATRQPLALMLADALDAPTKDQRLFSLQRLGDVALFIAGLFADDLQYAAVDVDYYVSMGGGAYSTLSQHARGTVKGRAFGEVFAELGDKFPLFVDALNDMRADVSQTTDVDILRQYEVWLKTGSQRAERLLREQGVTPMQSARSDWDH